MSVIFEKLEHDNKEKIEEMSVFAGDVFFKYYDSMLIPGQAAYMKDLFLSPESIKEKLSPAHTPEIIFEFVKDEETGENLGFVSYWITEDEKLGKICYLDKYYLKEESRGKGLGNVLMEHVKIFCIENSLPQIQLNVNKYNKTVEIYKKLGFDVLRAEIRQIGNGYVMDDYVMYLDIPAEDSSSEK